jgi:hypothetical protein
MSLLEKLARIACQFFKQRIINFCYCHFFILFIFWKMILHRVIHYKQAQLVGIRSFQLDGEYDYRPPAAVLEMTTMAVIPEQVTPETVLSPVAVRTGAEVFPSLEECCELADMRYRKSFVAARNDGTIYIVASHLSQDAMRDLKAFCCVQLNGGT